ncbi:hypothetical protein GCM10010357_15590 [Streptomyces luteireticuli]|uniref:Uncharacterized protein n=1 Tax=Streptomyces luteireticuli TaxID=173858 RepID=A0ABN0YH96_9ACTN
MVIAGAAGLPYQERGLRPVGAGWVVRRVRLTPSQSAPQCCADRYLQVPARYGVTVRGSVRHGSAWVRAADPAFCEDMDDGRVPCSAGSRRAMCPYELCPGPGRRAFHWYFTHCCHD